MKINDRVEIPLVLDMNPYTVNGREKAEEEKEEQKKRKEASTAEEVVEEENGGKGGDETKSGGGGGGSGDSGDKKKIDSTDEGEGGMVSSLRTMTKEEEEGLYELCGITIHSGNADNGHYWSYAKDRETEEWSEFNDDTVSKWDVDDLEQDCFGGATSNSTYKSSQNAYMLYYRKKSLGIPSVSISSDEIPNDLLDEIVGQNRVNAKKQSLVNFEYFEFVDSLLSSSKQVGEVEGLEGVEGVKGVEGKRSDQEKEQTVTKEELPSNEQMTKYNLTFLLGAFVHSGKDMLSRIEGTKECQRKASSNSTHNMSDSDDDADKKNSSSSSSSSSSSNNKSNTTVRLSPMQVWHDRLLVSLTKHTNIAAWFLNEMHEITCLDPSKFDRMLKLSSSFSSASSSSCMTMEMMARSVVEHCVVLCTKSNQEYAVRSVQSFVSTVCQHLVQWGKRLPDSEKQKTKDDSYATSLITYEWDTKKRSNQIWLRCLIQKYVESSMTHTQYEADGMGRHGGKEKEKEEKKEKEEETSQQHVLSLLRAASRDLANMTSYPSVFIATVDCLMSMLNACSRAVVVVNASSSSTTSSSTSTTTTTTPTTSDENKFGEKENLDHESMIDQKTLQSLLCLVDEENCQHVKNGMLVSNLLCAMALASPSTFLRNIMPVLTVKIDDILNVVDEADHRAVFALVRAIMDSIQSIADTRSMHGTNDECTAVAYELMSCITDLVEKNCSDYYVHTITSMHLLIQLGRISPLARSYYHEHQQSVFHWWNDWLETNQSNKRNICTENARKRPSWVERAHPEPIFPTPNLQNLRKDVKCIQMNREDEVFANTNICEEIHWFEGHPESLVHRRVSVTWDEYNKARQVRERNFYQGTLMSFDEKTGFHLILYDDGEKKSYNLYTRLGIELLPLESRLPADSKVGEMGGEYLFFLFLFLFLFLSSFS